MIIKLFIFLSLFFFLTFTRPLITQALTSVSLFQITSDGSQQTQAQIDGELVAYTNHGGSQGIDIWGYDLGDEENFPIIERPGQQFLTDLYKDLIVYEDVDESSNYDVRLYDIEAEEDLLIAGGAGSQTSGVTNGKFVVYVNGGACGTIHSYNIKKNTSTQIGSGCSPLSISDDVVVWANGATGGTNIYGYNLKKSQAFDVVADLNFQESPSIFKNTVAYVEYTTGALGDFQAIKTKNIQTGEKKTIYETTTSAVQYPSISDKYIVWSESATQNVGGIKGAILKTGEVFEVQEQGPHQNSHTTTSIWNDTAVWMAWRTGNGDIYGANFPNSKSDQWKDIKVGAKLSDYSKPENCDIRVPSDFGTIQEGINASVNGNTICVEKGIYNEDVTIDKEIRLSGSGAKKTEIHGQNPDASGTVYITAKNVILEGFYIKGVGTHRGIGVVRQFENVHNTIIRFNHVVANSGQLAFLTDNAQQNNLVQQNILEGNNSPNIAKVNAFDNNKPTNKVDFINNTFLGTLLPTAFEPEVFSLDAGAPNSFFSKNVFNATGDMKGLVATNPSSELHENNFNSGPAFKVVSTWGDFVNAENNWWGDIDPSNNIQGSVDYTPFSFLKFKEN